MQPSTNRLPPAIFSEDRVYRYVLSREWIGGTGMVAFVGLNPSTATETVDDPTIRRCINYAKAWGYSGMYMLNLFAYRETDRLKMLKYADPIGPENDKYIRLISEIASKVVCAWGADGGHLGRDQDIHAIIKQQNLYCLQLTKGGHPQHPLYLKKTLTPVPFRRQS